MSVQNYGLQILPNGIRLLGLKNNKEINAIAFLQENHLIPDSELLLPDREKLIKLLNQLKSHFRLEERSIRVSLDNRLSVKGLIRFNDQLSQSENRFFFHWLSSFYLSSSLNDYKNYVEKRFKFGNYYYYLYYIRKEILEHYQEIIQHVGLKIDFIGLSQQIIVHTLENLYPRLMKKNHLILYPSNHAWECVAWYNHRIEFCETVFELDGSLSQEMNESLIRRGMNIRLFDNFLIVGEMEESPFLKKEIEKFLQIETLLINLFNHFKTSSNIKKKVSFQALQSFSYCLGLAYGNKK